MIIKRNKLTHCADVFPLLPRVDLLLRALGTRADDRPWDLTTHTENSTYFQPQFIKMVKALHRMQEGPLAELRTFIEKQKSFAISCMEVERHFSLTNV